MIRGWGVSDSEGALQVCRLEGHTSVVRSVSFSPDGSRVVSSSDADARIWNVETGSKVRCCVTLERFSLELTRLEHSELSKF